MKIEPYFPLAGFRYTFDSIRFVLDYWESTGEGHWPQPVSGYTQAPLTQFSVRGGAKFIGAIEVHAEIAVRLAGTLDDKGVRIGGCGADGRLVLIHYAFGVSLEDLAAAIGQPDIYQVQRRINSAIGYCCGNNRRGESYKNYRKFRKSRYQKVATIYSQGVAT